MLNRKKREFLDIGYNKLLKGNNLDYLINLSNRLASLEIKIYNDFLGIDKNNIQNCLRQFLIQRRLYTVFNIKIIEALGRKKRNLKMGLPKTFLAYLEEKENFRANTFLNKLRWKMFIFYWFLAGNYFILHFFLKGIKLLFKKKIQRPYVYFDNLSKKNVPKENSKTIIDWYIKKDNDYKNIDITYNQLSIDEMVIEGINVYPIPIPIKIEISVTYLLKFFKSAILFSFKSFFKIFSEDYTNPLILKEYPLLYFSKKAKKSQFAKKYFFHNSTSIFRPLWTYEAEKKGSDVVLFYYSTNNAPLKFDKGYHKVYGNREFMTWKNFYVWDKFQKEYILGYLPKSNIKIVGPIWFESSGKKFIQNEIQNKLVAIFDIQTHNEYHIRRQGFPDRYITTPNMIKFHQDIIKAFNNIEDVKIILKRKRKESAWNDPDYISFINQNYRFEKYCEISPLIDATSLIKECFLSINYPPTSPALISRHEKKHTIYYDPTMKVSKLDKSLCEIQLISGYAELQNYINKLFS